MIIDFEMKTNQTLHKTHPGDDKLLFKESTTFFSYFRLEETLSPARFLRFCSHKTGSESTLK